MTGLGTNRAWVMVASRLLRRSERQCSVRLLGKKNCHESE